MPDDVPQDDAPQTFTAEDLERVRREAIEQARKEEREKLYPQLTKRDEQFKTMEQEVAELRKAEAARQKERDKAAAAAEQARKEKEEAELSAKDLLAQRQQEWDKQLEAVRQQSEQQVAALRAENEQREAIFAKERDFQALQLYIRDQVAAHQDDIAPELIDLINGNTQEEVDASVARMVEKTAAIVAGMRAATQQARAAMPGVSPGGGTAGIVPGLDTGEQQLTPEDIKGMSMQDFAKLRTRAGIAGRGQGQGIFG